MGDHRDDLIGEGLHFVQTIRPPQNEESGHEHPTQGRGIPDAASKFHCLTAAHFLELAPPRLNRTAPVADGSTRESSEHLRPQQADFWEPA